MYLLTFFSTLISCTKAASHGAIVVETDKKRNKFSIYSIFPFDLLLLLLSGGENNHRA